MPILGSAGAGSVRGFGLFGASAPVNLSTPVLSGSAIVGQTLTSSTGTWTGSPAPTFTYQWQRNGLNISGATSSSYTLTTSDYNTGVRCVVTATNIVASVSANSNSLMVAGIVPVNTAQPTISFSGGVLTTTNGSWSGYPAPTFTYQWTRNGANISGATGSSYTVQAADNNTTLRCRVTASNAAGSASATSSNSYQPYTRTIQYVVIAGGGGGSAGKPGQYEGGGGGAGGMIVVGNTTVNGGLPMTVTVGGGGAGAPSGSNVGTQGQSSSFNGTTCTGGGHGSGNTFGGNGGSGGGSWWNPPQNGNGKGIPGQGNDGWGYSGAQGGGGGGKGAAATDRNGGAGGLTTIRGSSEYYAGGGGGSSSGTGGLGGGGRGSTGGGANNAEPGVSNSGSGGGGGGSTGTIPGASGGSGTVIIRVIGTSAATYSGSVQVNTVGSDYVYRFLGSGSITF